MDWLLASDEPGIRGRTRRDLLGEPATWLISWQRPDGGWNCDPCAADALDLLERRRLKDGRRRAGGLRRHG
ncbi:hypothetical protein ACWDA3_17615 [Nonomuraea rubra]